MGNASEMQDILEFLVDIPIDRCSADAEALLNGARIMRLKMLRAEAQQENAVQSYAEKLLSERDGKYIYPYKIEKAVNEWIEGQKHAEVYLKLQEFYCDRSEPESMFASSKHLLTTFLSEKLGLFNSDYRSFYGNVALSEMLGCEYVSDKARLDFLERIRLQINDPILFHFGRATILDRMGNHAQALENYGQVLAREDEAGWRYEEIFDKARKRAAELRHLL